MNEEINGYSIIGSVILPGTDIRLILGEGYRDDRLVYVVATADINPTDSWHNGTYFDGPNGRRNKSESRRHFLASLTEHFQRA